MYKMYIVYAYACNDYMYVFPLVRVMQDYYGQECGQERQKTKK